MRPRTSVRLGAVTAAIGYLLLASRDPIGRFEFSEVLKDFARLHLGEVRLGRGAVPERRGRPRDRRRLALATLLDLRLEARILRRQRVVVRDLEHALRAELDRKSTRLNSS